jgi:hypothetical protein
MRLLSVRSTVVMDRKVYLFGASITIFEETPLEA